MKQLLSKKLLLLTFASIAITSITISTGAQNSLDASNEIYPNKYPNNDTIMAHKETVPLVEEII